MSKATCSVESCDAQAKIKGWCKPHYMRQYRHGDLDVQRTVRQDDTCSVEGCEKKPHGHGLCAAHWKRWRKHGDPLAEVEARESQKGKTCRGPECDRPAVTKGLCNSHEYQERVRGALTPLRERIVNSGPCSLESCERPALTDGLCQTHYRRRLRGDENWAAPIVARAADGEGHVNDDGYRVISVNGRPKLEHRHLVEELLGRPLLRTESVHHVNGDRLANKTSGPLVPRAGKLRSGNLELWSTAQPAGQEVPAKVAYAREILALYGDLVPE